MLTQKAEKGIDPVTNKSGEEWYNHKGFFEHKLETPWIYDAGKEKEPQDRLRMPQPYLTPAWKTALTTFLLGSVGVEGANVPTTLFYSPDDQRKAVQDGWWVVKKYNCMGCHNIQVGQRSVLMDLPLYQNPDWKEQLPPNLTSEGARVDPNWLLGFLRDPSLSESSATKGNATTSPSATAPSGNASQSTPPVSSGTAQGGSQPAPPVTSTVSVGQTTSDLQNLQFHPQPGEDRNGVRRYLKARMPTFTFSPNELRLLVRFFMAVSAQQEPYIPEPIEPLNQNLALGPNEEKLARDLFTSEGAPCLKCHITDDNQLAGKTAPNFLLAAKRLKPQWTYRWLLNPQQISPGTAMPSGLFRKDGDRMVFNGETPAEFNDYHRDHAQLLVRYMFLLTPDEQRRLSATLPAAGKAATAPAAKEPPPTAHARRRAGSAQSLNSHSRKRSSGVVRLGHSQRRRAVAGRS
jgi:hypothetical protein